MDGHSHHDHQKRVLQVSKKGADAFRKSGEWDESMGEARGLNQGNSTACVIMCVYLSCVFSANNIDLCLSYK